MDSRRISRLVQLRLLDGGTAGHCVDQYSFLLFVLLLFTRGRHCYAEWATRKDLPCISSYYLLYPHPRNICHEDATRKLFPWNLSLSSMTSFTSVLPRCIHFLRPHSTTVIIRLTCVCIYSPQSNYLFVPLTAVHKQLLMSQYIHPSTQFWAIHSPDSR